MAIQTPTRRERMRASVAPFLSFFNGPFSRLNLARDVANFAVGNPQEMPIPAYVEALQRHVAPQDKDWFAYKMSEPESQRIVADTLTRRTGLAWDPADVAMTNGGFAALAVAMRALVEPGDEVVFLSPPWFFYEFLTLAAGGEPVRVKLDPPAFDLNLAGIDAAITSRTRAVIINSPHNPSGRIYSADVLRELATAPVRCERPHRPPDLDHQRRAVQPDRLRRPQLQLARRALPAHDHHLLVRQDPARAG